VYAGGRSNFPLALVWIEGVIPVHAETGMRFHDDKSNWHEISLALRHAPFWMTLKFRCDPLFWFQLADAGPRQVFDGENVEFRLHLAIAFAVLTPPEWVCRESMR
jgi:hypothetical protein